MSSQVYEYKQGDTEPPLAAWLRDEAGNPIPTPTEVWLRVGRTTTGLAWTRQATIIGPTAGLGLLVQCELATGDLDHAGDWLVEWRCLYSGGRQLTVPNDDYDILKVEATL